MKIVRKNVRKIVRKGVKKVAKKIVMKNVTKFVTFYRHDLHNGFPSRFFLTFVICKNAGS